MSQLNTVPSCKVTFTSLSDQFSKLRANWRLPSLPSSAKLITRVHRLQLPTAQTSSKMALTKSSRRPLSCDICPFGDVILVVGPDEIRLRVSSRCLKAASETFRALLILDELGINDHNPKEFTLSNDDIDAMHLICSILHHQNSIIPQYIEPAMVLNIAIASDKWKLTQALRFAIPHLPGQSGFHSIPEWI